jgi:hypothetical protein
MHRRRFLVGGAAATAALLLPAGDAAGATSYPMAASFVSNPDLPTLLPADQWPGTPVDAAGKFLNHEFPYVNRFSTVIKYWVQPNPQRAEKEAALFQLPVLKTEAFLHDLADVIVWLGHASFFIRLGGSTFLLDPVLGNLPAFGKRLSELPLDPTALTGVDYILLSHAHYDHCDKPSLRQLFAQNPQAQFLTGLGMDKLLKGWLPGATVQTAGWYQQYRTKAGLRVTFLPARHWSNRTPWNKNETLWGAFVLQTGGRQVYFGETQATAATSGMPASSSLTLTWPSSEPGPMPRAGLWPPTTRTLPTPCRPSTIRAPRYWCPCTTAPST